MPAWDYIGGNIGQDTSAANFTPGSLPTGTHQAGDLLLYALVARNGEVPSLSGDWTLLNSSPTASNGSTGSGSVSRLWVYYHIRGGSAPNYDVTRGTGPDLCIYGFHVFRPASGFTFEVVVSSGETDGSTTTSHTHAAVDTGSYTDCLIGHYISTGSSNGADTFNATDPNSASSGSTGSTGTMATNAWQRRGNLGTTNLLDGSLHMAVAIKTSAGSTGTLSATMTTARRNASVAFVIRQKAVGYTLTADLGSYVLAGAAASLLKWAKVEADAGSYALTGTVVDLIAPVSVLRDTFATLDTADTWDETDTGGYVNIVGGELVIDAVPDYPFIRSKKFFSLTGTRMLVKIPGVGTVNGAVDGRQIVWAFEGVGASQYVGFLINEDNSVTAWYQDGASGVYPAFEPYSAATLWVSIREAGGTIYWEYSADGSSWTTLYSHASFSWKSKGRITFYSGHWNGGETPVRSGRWDNLNSLAIAYTLSLDAGAYSVAGTDAGLLKGSKIIADAGSLSIDGVAAGLLVGHKLAADAGSMSISGTVAGLLAGWKLAADAGAYIISGVDATLVHDEAGSFTLSADAGGYTLDGVAASLLFGRLVKADAGSYALVGTDAALKLGARVFADAGAYALNGASADLLRAARLSADAGALSITGVAASLEYGARLPADPGSIIIIGTDAGLIYVPALHYDFDADPGAIVIVGSNANLVRAGFARLSTASILLTGV